MVPGPTSLSWMSAIATRRILGSTGVSPRASSLTFSPLMSEINDAALGMSDSSISPRGDRMRLPVAVVSKARRCIGDLGWTGLRAPGSNASTQIAGFSFAVEKTGMTTVLKLNVEVAAAIYLLA